MKPTIPFSEFSKLDLRIGTVTSAKPIKGTDSLLRLEVDLGDEGTRQLVAGLAKTHISAELIGKSIVVLVNLEEREIRGVVSSGMLLAADAGGVPVLLVPEREVAKGMTVR